MNHFHFNKKRVLKYSLLFFWLLFTCSVLAYQVYASCKCKRDSSNINAKAMARVEATIKFNGNTMDTYLSEFIDYINYNNLHIKEYKETKVFGSKGSEDVKTEILITQRVLTILKDSLMSNINRDVSKAIGEK